MLMLGLGFLRNAITRLANAINGAAESFETLDARLRASLRLDDADDLPPVVQARHVGNLAAVEEKDSEGNGEPSAAGKRKGKS